MAGFMLESQVGADGWEFRLQRRKLLLKRAGIIPPGEWSAHAAGTKGVPLLLALLESRQADLAGDAIKVSHDEVAGLSAAEADHLALPPVATHAVRLEREHPIGDPRFQVSLSWIGRDGVVLAGVRRQGTSLTSGSQHFLVLDPIRGMLDALVELNAAAKSGDLDARMTAFAAFSRRLTEVTGDVRADTYLSGLTIHHATGLGIDFTARGGEDFFSPILYGDAPAPHSDHNDEPAHEPLLPRAHANRFSRERFVEQGARGHYVVGQGVYVVLDKPVVAALSVVERVNKSDRETRAEFRKDPYKFLVPALEAEGADGSVIAELKGYGERVLGVGLWQQAKLSFKLPVAREWFPDEDAEIFTFFLGEDPPLVVRREDVADLKDAVEQAETAGAPRFDFAGRSYPFSTDLADDIRKLIGIVEPDEKASEAPESPEKKAVEVWAARTRNNEEELTYSAALKTARRHLSANVDGLPLKRPPLKHQRDGIAWLQAALLSGMPGVLLADDMGLGKTFQVLAFLKWLRDGMGAGRVRQPILIVAPKTLLGTWLSEIDDHLGRDALGRIVRAYESGLADLKSGTGGNDVKLGTQTLLVDRLESADVVLTTYETLRDYHLSFAKVRFAVAAFDEAQKLKSPASLMNQGAKAQQADFTIVMTGTPIENGVVDLWTMLDILWPGLIKLSARDFLKHYGEDDPARREELRDKLIAPAVHDDERLQPVMLRRFKVDVLDGLPPRGTKVITEPMPEAQARAYDAALGQVGEKPGDTLAALQALRTISLHPTLIVPSSTAEHEAFINASARMKALIQILDDIAKLGEKVLVFVDLREAQRALMLVLQHRYRLKRAPAVINGSTASTVRNQIREDFQTRPPGFDILLLGPKAAGFGLTLTAANHVVHLNRWWNPAVEDQCSDRVYRIGQTRPVTVWLPQARHPRLGDSSYDVLLHGLLDEKRALSREIVVPTQLNEGDFRRLYEQALGRKSKQSADDVDRMDWRSFERWVANELTAAGMGVNETPSSGDGGADLLAQATYGRRFILQCKHRAGGGDRTVDEGAVAEVIAAASRYAQYRDATLAVVTNGRFELAAQKRATEASVLLIDGSALADLAGILVGTLRT